MQTFPCPDCDYKAKQKAHLQTHFKSFHKGEIFQCPECEYKAKQLGSLKRHIQKIHKGNGQKSGKSEECQSKATWESYLMKQIFK